MNKIFGIAKDIFLEFKRKFFIFKRGKIIKKYTQENKILKLQLGSNISSLKNWLSSDLTPLKKNHIYLDVRKEFPFRENFLDYIYSEHLIEHLSWDDGLHMLNESYRILKPGGRIRISTPDLQVILSLYYDNREIVNRYIKWSIDKYGDNKLLYYSGFVINNFFRKWNHQFLYDESLLKLALEISGFIHIQKMKYNQSEDINLRNIERHGDNVGNIEMIEFETMIFEAKKPNQ